MLSTPDQEVQPLVHPVEIAIVTSQFNVELTHSLEKHCVSTLLQYGLTESQIHTYTVPGALEIPIAASRLAAKKKFAAIIALGVVMKGDTYHFELVADQAAAGCMQVALTYQLPVIFEVLAVYTPEQAALRCADNQQNKGIEAALATLKVLHTLQSLEQN